MGIFAQNANESATVVSDFASVLEKAFNPYDDKSLRVPFYLTSTYRQRLGVRGVSMLMNPNNVSFKQAKRISRKDTQGGAIFYHWTNRMGRDNDVLEMEFTGKTGNINIRTGTVANGGYGMFQNQSSGRGPIEWLNRQAEQATQTGERDSVTVSVQGDGYSVSGATKLANFMNLYSLTREPTVDPKTGAPVYYYINYSSPMFANTFVTFIGHFSRVMDLADSAENPFSKDYNFGFTVLSSMPSLDYLYTTICQNLRTVFMNPI